MKHLLGKTWPRLPPFTSEMVAKMYTAETETTIVIEMPAKRAIRERSSSTERVTVAVDDGNYRLEHRAFEVNQAQLDGLHPLLCVLATISMRVPSRRELFCNAVEDNNKISFSVAALECGVRL